jgi:hypothetical protein
MATELMKWRGGVSPADDVDETTFPVFTWDPLTTSVPTFALVSGWVVTEPPTEVDGHLVTVDSDFPEGQVLPNGDFSIGWTAHYSAGPGNTTGVVDQLVVPVLHVVSPALDEPKTPRWVAAFLVSAM